MICKYSNTCFRLVEEVLSRAVFSFVAYCVLKKVRGNKICWLKFSREPCMCESLTRENVFVQEEGLKTRIFFAREL